MQKLNTIILYRLEGVAFVFKTSVLFFPYSPPNASWNHFPDSFLGSRSSSPAPTLAYPMYCWVLPNSIQSQLERCPTTERSPYILKKNSYLFLQNLHIEGRQSIGVFPFFAACLVLNKLFVPPTIQSMLLCLICLPSIVVSRAIVSVCWCNFSNDMLTLLNKLMFCLPTNIIYRDPVTLH